MDFPTEAPSLETFPRLLCSLASVCHGDSRWELTTLRLWVSELTLPTWWCSLPLPLPPQREADGPQVTYTVCSEQCLPLSSAPCDRENCDGDFGECTYGGQPVWLAMSSFCLSLPHRSDHLCGYLNLHACIILFQGMPPSPTTC